MAEGAGGWPSTNSRVRVLREIVIFTACALRGLTCTSKYKGYVLVLGASFVIKSL